MSLGLRILHDVIGKGPAVEPQQSYRISLSIWLDQGEPVLWSESLRFMAFGLSDQSQISEDGRTLTTDYRVDKAFLFGGLYEGIKGMRVGGKRILKITPTLSKRNRGVENIIPPNAFLNVEITIHEERKMV